MDLSQWTSAIAETPGLRQLAIVVFALVLALLALGLTRSQVMRLILGEGALVGVVGVGLGLLGGWWYAGTHSP